MVKNDYIDELQQQRTVNYDDNQVQGTLNSVKPNDRSILAANRKQHKNKYSKYSQNMHDPIQETIRKAIELSKAVETETEMNKSILTKGTTVPTFTASNNLPRYFNISYDNINSVIPSDPFTFGFSKIGMILSPHGVKGEMKIQLDTDFAEDRIMSGKIIYVKKPSRMAPRPIRIVSGRKQQGNIYLLSVENIRTRLGASIFKNYEVFVKQQDRPSLNDDEYLIRDLIGLKCYVIMSNSTIDGNNSDANLKMIGTVVGIVPPDELCESQALMKLMHSMLEIRKINNNELCLIPLVPQIVTNINIRSNSIIIDPPSGLLDFVYYETPKKVAIKGYLPSHIDRINKKERKYLSKSITIL
eukprot:gene5888-8122_t